MPRQIIIPGKEMRDDEDYEQLEQYQRSVAAQRDVLIMHQHYFYTDPQAITTLKDSVTRILSDGKPTEIIAHSFGGIIAIAAYLYNHQKQRNNVTRIVTIATPHKINIYGLRESKAVLGYEDTELAVPVITIGSLFDTYMPFFLTHYTHSKHRLLFGFHNDFIYKLPELRAGALSDILN